eukprot:6475462-Amphidinium_carterae.1
MSLSRMGHGLVQDALEDVSEVLVDPQSHVPGILDLRRCELSSSTKLAAVCQQARSGSQLVIGGPPLCTGSADEQVRHEVSQLEAMAEVYSVCLESGRPFVHVHDHDNPSSELWMMRSVHDSESVFVVDDLVDNPGCRMYTNSGRIAALSGIKSDAYDDLLELNTTRTPALRSQEGEPVPIPRTELYGAYTSRGVGVTQRTVSRPHVLRAMMRLAKKRERQDEFASCMLTHVVAGECFTVHRDMRNHSDTWSWVTSCGSYKGNGGRLWVASTTGTERPPKGLRLPPEFPASTRGEFLQTYRKWVRFDAHQWHGVEPVREGERYSVALFSPGYLYQLSQSHWQQLYDSGFKVHRMASKLGHQLTLRTWQGGVGSLAISSGMLATVAEGATMKSEAGQHVDEPEAWDVHPEYYDEIFDNITGVKLDAELVTKSRAQEMEFLRGLQAYSYSTVDVCMEKTGKRPIPVAWVDVNKGDADNPAVRSRLVVKETKYRTTLTDPAQSYASAPPYEALRFLLSMTMSPRDETEASFVLMFIDITRAHPHCKMRREVWVDLPSEDHRSREAGVCAKLDRCLYGLRDAGQSFELFVHEVLVGKMGFINGVWSPCIFVHSSINMQVFVYGDNFVARGSRSDLKWYQGELSLHMWVKLEGVLGPEPDLGDVHEIVCLNRVFRWAVHGGVTAIEIEADARHAEILCKQMGLGENSKSVVTPGVSDKDAGIGKPLTGGDITLFRSLCMRANYLATDRPELSYVTKEIARHMANPCEKGKDQMKRLCRFVQGVPRLVQRMEQQKPPSTMEGYSDANHAGCLRTRQSTSCSVITHGKHTIKFTSTTQQPIALSTAESEWYAMVKTSALCIGMANMARDYGRQLSVRILGDATAAGGIGARRGAGKVRHIETSTLWLQRMVTLGRVELARQPGKFNTADLGTKHLDSKTMWQHLTALGFEAREGKSALALKASV